MDVGDVEVDVQVVQADRLIDKVGQFDLCEFLEEWIDEVIRQISEEALSEDHLHSLVSVHLLHGLGGDQHADSEYK